MGKTGKMPAFVVFLGIINKSERGTFGPIIALVLILLVAVVRGLREKSGGNG